MLDKRTFKICEAVALGIDHYYLDNQHDRRDLTQADVMNARLVIPTLPKGWMLHADKLPWSCFNKKLKEKTNA